MTLTLDPFRYIPKRRVYGDRDDLRSFTEEEEVQTGPALPEQTLSDDPLNYDFDMCKAPWADDTMTGGTTLEARWRDPATVAAMRDADPRLQKLFQHAGFTDEVSGLRMAQGQYDAGHERERHDTIVKLTQILSDGNTADMDWGLINRLDFFKAQAEAVPVATGQSNLPEFTGAQPDNKRRIALFGLIGGVVLIAGAVIAML